jgi:hypothetical protein
MNSYLDQFQNAIKDLKDGQFLTHALPHLNTLLQTPFLVELVNTFLTQLSTETHFYPTRSSINYWHILNTDAFTLTLVRLKKTTASKFVNAYPYDKVIVPLTENIQYSHYKQLNPFPLDFLDKTKKITPFAIDQSLQKNTPYVIKKHEDIFSYQGGISEETILLSFSCRKSHSYGWEYDINTLFPVRLVTNVLQSARLEHTCKLLGELGNKSSIPNLFVFLKNPFHNVRWEAARAIMNIDFDKGLEALLILKKDTHPDIKQSVENALKQISALNLI